MKIAIIQFPGSNCESESLRAIRQAGMEAEEFLWNRDYNDLKDFDGYFIVGGFSYEDRSRSGIIASLDPLMKHIRVEAEKGKPVLGICNGAQILVETGLVPGLKDYAVGVALAENKRVKDGKVLGTDFYNTWVHIQLAVPSSSSAFSRHLKPSQPFSVPIAHGEGRFIIPTELLEEMKANNLTVFRYCDETGKISEEFPINPNGATYNLAAVTNVQGNVMAMMPHPERTPNGQPIFTSMRDYITEHRSVILNGAERNVLSFPRRRESGEAGSPIRSGMTDRQDDNQTTPPLNFTPPLLYPLPYSPSPDTLELITELIITDNEAATVQNTLRQLGMDVTITKANHWEIKLEESADKNKIQEQITTSGELFNNNKERLIRNPTLPSLLRKGGFAPSSSAEGEVRRGSRCLLVRHREDFIGEQKREVLASRFDLKNVTKITKGTLWKITGPHDTIDTLVDKILATHILFNPYSQECLEYDADLSERVYADIANGQLSSARSAYTSDPHLITPMNYPDLIKQNLTNCLTSTNLAIGKKRVGKVRDTYELPDKLILITTDRQSAFDRVLAAIPFKGQVLNQTSAWWFEKTKHIVANHVLAVPDPNVTIGKKCTVFPVEFVVRGYITGTTSTSAWVNYEKGMRDYCGNILPDGLKKNQKFDHPLVTPTTKSDEHDRLISPKEIVSEGLMTQAEWDYVSGKALELFIFGQKVAAEHGLILVDTKYEFGKDENGTIMIIDEMHTPDSSRYWISTSYEQRFAEGKEPENIDKEFLRLWFKDHCDPYNDKELPPAPEDLVIELSRRYIMLYEMITGEKFMFPDNTPTEQRITTNLNVSINV